MNKPWFSNKMLVNNLVFLLILVTTSCKSSITGVDPEVSSDKPNIVFIIADDMGWDVFGNLSGMNGTKPQTPTLDSLAKTGLTFTNNWVYPECSPTRAAMLTGKFGFRTGVGSVVSSSEGLNSSEIIIQKYINDNTNAAYSNAVIGKWHVSSTNDLKAPENFGIQYFSGFLSGGINDYYNWTETSNGVQKTISTYTTTHMVNKAADWMKTQDKPFFLWLALNAPHTPFHRPPLELITNKSLSNNQTTIDANPNTYYLAAIEAMDKEIGRLIGSMTSTQRENTLFVFIGDNGTPPKVAQLPVTRNTSKSTLYQGGINTPLIISGKGVTRKNEIETALVQCTDMFATFADYAGTGTTNYQDSKSIVPLFANSTSTKRTSIYSELFSKSAADGEGYTLRNSNYKWIHLNKGTDLLFNISTDPFESKNLLDQKLSTTEQTNYDELKSLKTALK